MAAPEAGPVAHGIPCQQTGISMRVHLETNLPGLAARIMLRMSASVTIDQFLEHASEKAKVQLKKLLFSGSMPEAMSLQVHACQVLLTPGAGAPSAYETIDLDTWGTCSLGELVGAPGSHQDAATTAQPALRTRITFLVQPPELQMHLHHMRSRDEPLISPCSAPPPLLPVPSAALPEQPSLMSWALQSTLEQVATWQQHQHQPLQLAFENGGRAGSLSNPLLDAGDDGQRSVRPGKGSKRRRQGLGPQEAGDGAAGSGEEAGAGEGSGAGNQTHRYQSRHATPINIVLLPATWAPGEGALAPGGLGAGGSGQALTLPQSITFGTQRLSETQGTGREARLGGAGASGANQGPNITPSPFQLGPTPVGHVAGNGHHGALLRGMASVDATPQGAGAAGSAGVLAADRPGRAGGVAMAMHSPLPVGPAAGPAAGTGATSGAAAAVVPPAAAAAGAAAAARAAAAGAAAGTIQEAAAGQLLYPVQAGRDGQAAPSQLPIPAEQGTDPHAPSASGQGQPSHLLQSGHIPNQPLQAGGSGSLALAGAVGLAATGANGGKSKRKRGEAGAGEATSSHPRTDTIQNSDDAWAAAGRLTEQLGGSVGKHQHQQQQRQQRADGSTGRLNATSPSAGRVETVTPLQNDGSPVAVAANAEGTTVTDPAAAPAVALSGKERNGSGVAEGGVSLAAGSSQQLRSRTRAGPGQAAGSLMGHALQAIRVPKLLAAAGGKPAASQPSGLHDEEDEDQSGGHMVLGTQPPTSGPAGSSQAASQAAASNRRKSLLLQAHQLQHQQQPTQDLSTVAATVLPTLSHQSQRSAQPSQPPAQPTQSASSLSRKQQKQRRQDAAAAEGVVTHGTGTVTQLIFGTQQSSCDREPPVPLRARRPVPTWDQSTGAQDGVQGSQGDGDQDGAQGDKVTVDREGDGEQVGEEDQAGMQVFTQRAPSADGVSEEGAEQQEGEAEQRVFTQAEDGAGSESSDDDEPTATQHQQQQQPRGTQPAADETTRERPASCQQPLAQAQPMGSKAALKERPASSQQPPAATQAQPTGSGAAGQVSAQGQVEGETAKQRKRRLLKQGIQAQQDNHVVLPTQALPAQVLTQVPDQALLVEVLATVPDQALPGQVLTQADPGQNGHVTQGGKAKGKKAAAAAAAAAVTSAGSPAGAAAAGLGAAGGSLLQAGVSPATQARNKKLQEQQQQPQLHQPDGATGGADSGLEAGREATKTKKSKKRKQADLGSQGPADGTAVPEEQLGSGEGGKGSASAQQPEKKHKKQGVVEQQLNGTVQADAQPAPGEKPKKKQKKKRQEGEDEEAAEAQAEVPLMNGNGDTSGGAGPATQPLGTVQPAGHLETLPEEQINEKKKKRKKQGAVQEAAGGEEQDAVAPQLAVEKPLKGKKHKAAGVQGADGTGDGGEGEEGPGVALDDPASLEKPLKGKKKKGKGKEQGAGNGPMEMDGAEGAVDGAAGAAEALLELQQGKRKKGAHEPRDPVGEQEPMGQPTGNLAGDVGAAGGQAGNWWVEGEEEGDQDVGEKRRKKKAKDKKKGRLVEGAEEQAGGGPERGRPAEGAAVSPLCQMERGKADGAEEPEHADALPDLALGKKMKEKKSKLKKMDGDAQGLDADGAPDEVPAAQPPAAAAQSQPSAAQPLPAADGQFLTTAERRKQQKQREREQGADQPAEATAAAAAEAAVPAGKAGRSKQAAALAAAPAAVAVAAGKAGPAAATGPAAIPVTGKHQGHVEDGQAKSGAQVAVEGKHRAQDGTQAPRSKKQQRELLERERTRQQEGGAVQEAGELRKAAGSNAKKGKGGAEEEAEEEEEDEASSPEASSSLAKTSPASSSPEASSSPAKASPAGSSPVASSSPAKASPAGSSSSDDSSSSSEQSSEAGGGSQGNASKRPDGSGPDTPAGADKGTPPTLERHGAGTSVSSISNDSGSGSGDEENKADGKAGKVAGTAAAVNASGASSSSGSGDEDSESNGDSGSEGEAGKKLKGKPAAPAASDAGGSSASGTSSASGSESESDSGSDAEASKKLNGKKSSPVGSPAGSASSGSDDGTSSASGASGADKSDSGDSSENHGNVKPCTQEFLATFAPESLDQVLRKKMGIPDDDEPDEGPGAQAKDNTGAGPSGARAGAAGTQPGSQAANGAWNTKSKPKVAPGAVEEAVDDPLEVYCLRFGGLSMEASAPLPKQLGPLRKLLSGHLKEYINGERCRNNKPALATMRFVPTDKPAWWPHNVVYSSQGVASGGREETELLYRKLRAATLEFKERLQQDLEAGRL